MRQIPEIAIINQNINYKISVMTVPLQPLPENKQYLCLQATSVS